MIYLDHAASTPLSPRALAVLQESYGRDFANPSASHRLGHDVALRIDVARKRFLQTLKAESTHDLIFTSSATESNALVIHSFQHIDFSKADHPSVTVPASRKQANGIPELVILTHVNSASGELLDVETRAHAIKAQYPLAHIHVDASQSFMKHPLRLTSIDSVALSAHKMGGPRGIAALVVRKEHRLRPLIEGGGHEQGLRSGTPAAPLIFAWEASLSEERPLGRIQNLAFTLRNRLLALIPEVSFPFSESSSPYITLLILPKIGSDILMRHLEEKEIFVSSSSACSSHIKGANPTFVALGIPEKLHKHVLRISLSQSTTESEIETFALELAGVYNRLKRYA